MEIKFYESADGSGSSERFSRWSGYQNAIENAPFNYGFARNGIFLAYAFIGVS